MTITFASKTSGLRKEGKGAENLSLSRYEEDHMTGNSCGKSASIERYLSNINFPIISLTWKMVARCHDMYFRKEPKRTTETLGEQVHRGNAITYQNLEHGIM